LKLIEYFVVNEYEFNQLDSNLTHKEDFIVFSLTKKTYIVILNKMCLLHNYFIYLIILPNSIVMGKFVMLMVLSTLAYKIVKTILVFRNIKLFYKQIDKMYLS